MEVDLKSIDIFKIAVTGGAASGKTSVCRRFQEKGFQVIYLDMLAREVVEPGQPAYEKMIHVFGSGVVTDSGELDRFCLRRLMTDSPHAKKKIENIVQPEILRLMSDRIAELAGKGERAVVVEVPLLFELGMEKDFHYSVLVTIDQEIQVGRLMVRDSVLEKEARGLLKIQMSQDHKIKLADILIENKGTLEKLQFSTDVVIDKINENINNMSKSLDR